MREIKFRAWDKFNACWIRAYGGRIDDHVSPWNRHSQYIVSQYTGLKDKNCKEIYEGDLLDVDCGNRIVEVVWFEPQACFDTNVVKICDTFSYFSALKNSDWRYRCEVIGNIYEHPEGVKDV